MGRGSDTLVSLLWASWGYWLALAAALAVMIWLVLRVRARFRDDEDPAADAHQMLSQFRDLRREGGLSDDEFRSIKGRLMERLDGSDRAPEASTPDDQPQGRSSPSHPEHQPPREPVPPSSAERTPRGENDEMTRHDRPPAKEF